MKYLKAYSTCSMKAAPFTREVPARREASLNGAKTMRFSTMCASVSTASVKKCEVPRQRTKSLGDKAAVTSAWCMYASSHPLNAR